MLEVYEDGVKRLRFQRTATSVGALNVGNDTADQSEQNQICTRDIHISFSNYKQSVLIRIQSAWGSYLEFSLATSRRLTFGNTFKRADIVLSDGRSMIRGTSGDDEDVIRL